MIERKLIFWFLQTDEQIPVECLEDSVLVGRSSNCDICLKDYFHGDAAAIETISAEHFKLSCRETGEFDIMDLGSTNGTRRGNEKLTPWKSYQLSHKDVIQVGKRESFRIRILKPEEEYPSYTLSGITRREPDTELIQGIHFDDLEEVFFVDGRQIPNGHLNEQEHDLLAILYKYKGTDCTFYEIKEAVWGIQKVKENTVSQKITSLRSKLDNISDGSGKRYIKNVHGFGYKYQPPYDS